MWEGKLPCGVGVPLNASVSAPFGAHPTAIPPIPSRSPPPRGGWVGGGEGDAVCDQASSDRLVAVDRAPSLRDRGSSDRRGHAVNPRLPEPRRSKGRPSVVDSLLVHVLQRGHPPSFGAARSGDWISPPLHAPFVHPLSPRGECVGGGRISGRAWTRSTSRAAGHLQRLM